MTRGIYLALSNPISGGSEVEFNRWYDHVHSPEALNYPGFVEARRYRLSQEQIRDQGLPAPYRYAVVYDVESVERIPECREFAPILAAASREFVSPTIDATGVFAYVFEEISRITQPRELFGPDREDNG